ncbi:MAG: O-methyltransferase [Thermoplasmatota archaeon]
MPAEGGLAKEVAAYLRASTVTETPLQSRMRRRTEEEKLPAIPPETGTALRMLVAACGASRVLEIGALMGYSATWIASALPAHARFETIEMNPGRAGSTEANLKECRLFDHVERVDWERDGGRPKLPVEHSGRSAIVHQADARTVLEAFVRSPPARPFDFVFIDADKTQYSQYLDAAVALVRTGGVIAADNLLWSGRVADPTDRTPETEAIRSYTKKIFSHPRLLSALLPVGDGLGVSIVK